MVVDALCRMTMGSVYHVDESQKNLVKEAHRLARLGVRLKYFLNGGFMVHHNSQSSLVVEVKLKQHFNRPLMELKKSILGKLNEAFNLGGIVS